MFTQNIKLHVISLIILLSGCAVVSQDMVDRAQATANRALASAQTANTRAENAEKPRKMHIKQQEMQIMITTE